MVVNIANKEKYNQANEQELRLGNNKTFKERRNKEIKTTVLLLDYEIQSHACCNLFTDEQKSISIELRDD